MAFSIFKCALDHTDIALSRKVGYLLTGLTTAVLDGCSYSKMDVLSRSVIVV